MFQNRSLDMRWAEDEDGVENPHHNRRTQIHDRGGAERVQRALRKRLKEDVQEAMAVPLVPVHSLHLPRSPDFLLH